MSLQLTRLQAALNGEPTNGVVPKKLTPEEEAAKKKAQEEMMFNFKKASEEFFRIYHKETCNHWY